MRYSLISDQELLSRCADSGDCAAWDEFLRRFHRLIARVAHRTARRWGETRPSILDDLVQDTYVKLCDPRRRILADFEQRHANSFSAYISVITANLVNDHFKSEHTEKHGLGQLVTNADDHEAAADNSGGGSASALEGALLRREIDGLLRGVKAPTAERDRQIFWFYYRWGMSAREIAAIPHINLTIKGVESTLQRTTRIVRDLLSTREPVPPTTTNRFPDSRLVIR